MTPLAFRYRSRRLSTRRTVALAGLGIFAAFLLACSPGSPGNSGKAAPRSSLKKLRIEPARIVSSPAFPGRPLRVFGLGPGNDEKELAATSVEFRSSDPAIATVSAAGEILFLQPGIATIVVTAEGVEARVPVEIRTPPIALEVKQVSPGEVTVVVDKLRPGQRFRIFGTTDLEKGVTRIAGCERLDLLMKGATPLAEVQLEGEGVTYTEAKVPFPAQAKTLALQVVTDDCAISREVIADPSAAGSRSD